MKKIIISSIFAVVLVFSACSNSANPKGAKEAIDTTKLKTGDAYYQCKMHHDIISDKPGTCPKCGMELLKVEKRQLQ